MSARVLVGLWRDLRGGVLGTLAVLAGAAPALRSAPALQAGDNPGEVQPALEGLELGPSPALTPQAQRATFALPPGFTIELVAAEPLVVDPVVARFDAQGRLWVVEMRGYMPTVDGAGEDAPSGRIAVLSDVDGDGRMDTRSEFLEGLVLPRAVAPWRDGALVIAPPELLFCRDTDGDGRADERTVVDRGLGGLASPEHAVNGLLFTRDNWFQCANHDRRYRERDGRWEIQATAGGGQWGLSHDDAGRVFYNTNATALRCDLVSAHYSARNPNHGPVSGWNVDVGADGTTWPARPTPGVNRGYQAGTLRADFTLRSLTAACAPWIYRGDALADGCTGDAFVCEPAANLVKRYRLTFGSDGRPRAEHAWDGREFLTSTDERFRPVDLTEGPDGALYVVDFYRGILQHRIFLTTFLRGQILERGLHEPVGLGRVWRIVARGARPAPAPNFVEATWDQLASALAHPNGWVRDTAKRVLVEEGQDVRDAHEAVRELALRATAPVTRATALWTLEGMGALRTWDRQLFASALADPSADVRRSALRLAEELPVPTRILADAAADPDVRQQALLSLGARGAAADAATLELLTLDASVAEDRSAVLSGLRGRELDYLERVLGDERWTTPEEGRETLLRLLARAVAREGREDRIARALALSAELPDEQSWARDAIAATIAAERPAVGEPEPLDELNRLAFEDGRALYAEVCAACHLASGRGEPGKGPPLRRSPWVLGDDARLVRVLRDGLTGPIVVNGLQWAAEMPAWSASDEDIAAVLTYVRREWGHTAEPVSAERVRAVREQGPPRSTPWTSAELDALAR